MLINISARHCTVADSVRRRAEDRLRKLIRFEPRIDSSELVFEQDHGLYAVEARTFVAGRSTIVAHATGTDPRAALDQAVSRVARQLRRQRERSRDHSAVRVAASSDSSMKGAGIR